MSVQLILNRQGQYSGYIPTGATTVVTGNAGSTEYVGDPSFLGSGGASPWNNFSSTSQLTGVVATTNQIPGAWQGFHTQTGGGFKTVTAPAASSTGLRLYEPSTSSGITGYSGMCQIVNGLQPGTAYRMQIEVSNFPASATYSQSLWLPGFGGPGSADFQLPNGMWVQKLGATASGISTSSTSIWTSTSGWSSSWTQISATEAYIDFTVFSFAGGSAFNPNQLLYLEFYSSNQGTGEYLGIRKLSIREAPETIITTEVNDGKVICDLYEDETIPLTLSIDDFKNAAESVQSYSKAFDLPATKRNNKIFENIFDITRLTQGGAPYEKWNPYMITQAELKEDGYTIFKGFLRLIDITTKEGETSYNVNLYSDPVILAEVLGTRTLNDLDLIELNHSFDSDNIKNSWVDSTGLELDVALANTDSFAYSSTIGNLTHTNVIKYPFCNWIGSYVIDTSNVIDLQNLEEAFRPWISCKYLIDKMVYEAGFTYQSTFLESTEFTKLYMDLNWGQGLDTQGGGFQQFISSLNSASSQCGIGINTGAWDNTLAIPVKLDLNDPTNDRWDETNWKFTADANNLMVVVEYEFTFYNSDSSARQVWVMFNRYDSSSAFVGNVTGSSSGIVIVPPSGVNYTTGSFTVFLNNNEWIRPVFQGEMAGASPAICQLQVSTPTNYVNWQVSGSANKTPSMLMAGRGDLGQWAFMKGIVNMFNLVIMPDKDNPTNLLIEPYNDIFITNSDSEQLDWTKKIDVSEIKLTPLDLSSSVKFTYEDDENDYCLKKYKGATNGYLYGTKELDFSALTALIGVEEIIASPFAPTIVKPISPAYDVRLNTANIYTGNEDGTEFSDFDNKPRIAYNNGVQALITGSYDSPLQNSASAKFTNEDEFLQFSHLSTPYTSTTPGDDYNFGECSLYSPNYPTPNNLYNLYWAAYYDQLYNVNTRVMRIKVKLNPSDIANFNFYDTVFIKNREYRVNNINYQPNQLSTVEFILIP
jgi:hypothetical protein